MKKTVKKYPRRCVTPRCHGVIASEACHTNKCPRCVWRAYVENNPLRAAFKQIRTHAREREKSFTLTFERFKELAEKTDYLKRKGKTSLSFHIDRIENALGYHDWNVQVITLAENNRKNFVPYFQDMSKSEWKLCREFDDSHNRELQTVADAVAKIHKPGSVQFWAEYNRRKFDMMEKAA